MAVPNLSGPSPGQQLAAPVDQHQPAIGTDSFYLAPFFLLLFVSAKSIKKSNEIQPDLNLAPIHLAPF